ncbi:phthiocerol/phthiodiolone dimycocerosyl transferase family protein [Streptomyces sp. 4F14]|uniref:phthiocerol/phthiodiolone dimycocerosyl transferase family protein n=1 Tax=Streptomyces sp. 4F14 TaxID=3394380 RepID=UPI003A88E49D
MERLLGAHELAIFRSGGRVLVICEVEGDVDRGLLAEALRLLTEFHPVLLGRFVPDGATCVVRDGDRAAQRVPIDRFTDVREEAQVVQDWLNGPLLRVAVSDPGPRTTIALGMPRALVDGSAYIALHKRLWSLYTALSQREDIAAPHVIAGGLASPSLDDRVREAFTDGEVTAFLESRAALRDAVPSVLPVRGREPGGFGVVRLELDAERTQLFAEHAHGVGLSVHSLVCGVLLAGARGLMRPPGGAVTLACVSAVDLRARLTPPIDPESVQSSASSSTTTLDVLDSPDPVDLGRAVASRLRSDLDARVPDLDVATIPHLTPATVPRLPTLIVTNLHTIPAPTLPPSLTLTGWRILPLVDMPVPLATVTRFAGRLAIDLPYPRRWYDDETMRRFLDAASGVFDEVLARWAAPTP